MISLENRRVYRRCQSVIVKWSVARESNSLLYHFHFSLAGRSNFLNGRRRRGAPRVDRTTRRARCARARGVADAPIRSPNVTLRKGGIRKHWHMQYGSFGVQVAICLKQILEMRGEGIHTTAFLLNGIVHSSPPLVEERKNKEGTPGRETKESQP